MKKQTFSLENVLVIIILCVLLSPMWTPLIVRLWSGCSFSVLLEDHKTMEKIRETNRLAAEAYEVHLKDLREERSRLIQEGCLDPRAVNHP